MIQLMELKEDISKAPECENEIFLKDGRKLYYSCYGPEDGVPVIFNHGWPDCRLFLKPVAKVADELAVRIISPDRPGFGRSDFKKARTILDWPSDIEELADHLGLERFHMLGHSGGCPYTLACAYKIKDRLLGAGEVSGLAPLNDDSLNGLSVHRKALFGLVKNARWLHEPLLSLGTMIDPKVFVYHLVLAFPGADSEIIKNTPGHADIIKEAFANGPKGPAYELSLFGDSWGFNLEKIELPIRIWHGRKDTVVPVCMGEYLAEKIPDSLPRYYKNEAHMMIYKKIKEILKDLTGNKTG